MAYEEKKRSGVEKRQDYGDILKKDTQGNLTFGVVG